MDPPAPPALITLSFFSCVICLFNLVAILKCHTWGLNLYGKFLQLDFVFKVCLLALELNVFVAEVEEVLLLGLQLDLVRLAPLHVLVLLR